MICDDPSQPDCQGEDPPPPPPPPPSEPPGITYSDGFYKGSDGYYHWDGLPPEGDLSPSVVTDARANAQAPDQTGDGWVQGYMKYSNGDEGKVDLSVDAWNATTRLLQGGSVPGTWVHCGGGGFGHCDNEELYTDRKNLNLASYVCGVTVAAGGTAFARKTLPFGINVQLSVKIFGYNVLEAWGQGDRFLTPHTAVGVSCNGESSPPPTPPSGGPPGTGPTVETVPASEYIWSTPDYVTCEQMEYHYRYSDGSVSDSWFGWQC